MSKGVNPSSDELKKDLDYEIFLSYAREDRSRALWFIRAFEARGWRIFWDEESVPVGVAFPRFLQEKINASQSVVVLWTMASINSDWVDAEARLGKERGVLFPVLLDPNISNKVPFGLRHINSSPLYDWDGQSEHPAFERLIRDLANFFSISVDKKNFGDHVPAAGVAGMTRYGPVSFCGGPENVEPEVVSSFDEFESIYGGLEPLVLCERNEEATRIGYVAHTAQAFFDSGGQKLYVSRVYSPADGTELLDGIARCNLTIESGSAALVAQWPGSGGNLCINIKVLRTEALAYQKEGIDKLQVRRAVAGQLLEVLPYSTSTADDDPVECTTLRVVRAAPDGRQIFIDHQFRPTPIRSDQTVNFIRLAISIKDGVKTVQKFLDLSTSAEDEDFVGKCLSQKRWIIPDEKLLPIYWREIWPLVWLDWHPSDLGGAESEIEIAHLVMALQGSHDLIGGHDGKIVTPSKLVGTVRPSDQTGSGIASLEYDDIDVLLIPDAGAYRDRKLCVEAAQGLLKSPHRRGFAIIDTPQDATVGEAINFRDQLSGDAAVFYPWVEIDCPVVGNAVLIPPSGFAAGLYASIDPMENPWNRPKIRVGPHTMRISVDTITKNVETLEYERINVLHVIDGRAQLKGTEKLLEPKLLETPFDKLRFIRLHQHIVKSIGRHLSSSCFEPITQAFIDERRTEIEGFLTQLWKSGVLIGEAVEDAFNVSFDDYDIVGSDILRVQIGLSLPNPPPYGLFHITIVLPIYLDTMNWQQKWSTPTSDLL